MIGLRIPPTLARTAIALKAMPKTMLHFMILSVNPQYRLCPGSVVLSQHCFFY
jgi:hypothetical protein